MEKQKVVFSVVICLCSVLTSCVGECIVGSVTSTCSSGWGSYVGVPVATCFTVSGTGVVINPCRLVLWFRTENYPLWFLTLDQGTMYSTSAVAQYRQT